MEWTYNDGGRAEAGFRGVTGDCVCRAIAIATERPYREIYDLINEYGKREHTGKRKTGKSSARTGGISKNDQKDHERPRLDMGSDYADRTGL